MTQAKTRLEAQTKAYARYASGLRLLDDAKEGMYHEIELQPRMDNVMPGVPIDQKAQKRLDTFVQKHKAGNRKRKAAQRARDEENKEKKQQVDSQNGGGPGQSRPESARHSSPNPPTFKQQPPSSTPSASSSSSLSSSTPQQSVSSSSSSPPTSPSVIAERLDNMSMETKRAPKKRHPDADIPKGLHHLSPYDDECDLCTLPISKGDHIIRSKECDHIMHTTCFTGELLAEETPCDEILCPHSSGCGKVFWQR